MSVTARGQVGQGSVWLESGALRHVELDVLTHPQCESTETSPASRGNIPANLNPKSDGVVHTMHGENRGLLKPLAPSLSNDTHRSRYVKHLLSEKLTKPEDSAGRTSTICLNSGKDSRDSTAHWHVEAITESKLPLRPVDDESSSQEEKNRDGRVSKRDHCLFWATRPKSQIGKVLTPTTVAVIGKMRTPGLPTGTENIGICANTTT
ncbi:hypothetical protein FB45DRAFT_156394 [Roridomyces roridus]|uniref:Uncharacterized protein n=1 Tax=Roridomyces roridus TaxID=1738132 RepID=A0AAD7BFF9_9AGAR|nr:hypothetical protein FB45DRAFT_156394 [Roridomyces roridus]